MKKITNMSRVRQYVIFFIIISSLNFSDTLFAQEQSAGETLPLFQSEVPLNLILEADFNAVFASKDDTTYFPAKITMADNDGQPRTVEIRLRKRGLTRARKDICTFPPLRLNFPKSEMKNTPFEGQNAIKLVTHCDKPAFYEDYVVNEYLIYKSYNVLTDSSFKARPAHIKYVFTDHPEDTLSKFSFFLEREKHMAERLGGKETESDKIHPGQVNPYQASLVDIFEYMIGNTDYSIYELHNIIIISDPTRRHLAVPVPYDFDWSGLISANYAVPNPALNITHVSERVYRGLKQNPAIIDHTIEIFKAGKAEIFSLYENDPYLSDNARKKALKYLDGFYNIVEDEKKVKSVFIENAREVNNE